MLHQTFQKMVFSQKITKQMILLKFADALFYIKFVIRPCLSFEGK